MNDVPATWAIAPLAEICYRIVDGSHNPPKGTGDGHPMLSARNIFDGKIVFDEFRWISDEDFAAEDARTRVKPGDVLLTIVGTIGRTAVVPESAKPFALQRSVAVLKPTTVASRYLAYCLESPIQQQWLLDNAKGTAQKGVYLKTLGSARIPIAPTKEQTRIVEKLEELLSDLDAGVVELKAAQRKLAQYRQSLLKAAVEGALTADWRAARTHSSEPQETGTDLLQRILTERRARWEAKQLAKYDEQGKVPPKGWQAKYLAPVAPDTSELPALPVGWIWASLEQLAEIQGGIQKQPSRAPKSNHHPFLRVANVSRGQLKLDEIHEIELFEGELERLALLRGDVLIVEGNGSRSEIGRCAVWDGSIEGAVHQNHLIRARPLLVAGEFLEAWLNSFRGIEYMTNLAATTSGLYTLSVGKISKIPVPLAPLSEQHEILAILSGTTNSCAEQEAAVEFALKQAAAQRKNILKAALTGQLVPQDPNDEPASALLERIRTERASQTGTAMPRGRKPRTTA